MTVMEMWCGDFRFLALLGMTRDGTVVGLSCCHPLLLVSGTGTGFVPLPSRERGYDVCCYSFMLRVLVRVML